MKFRAFICLVILLPVIAHSSDCESENLNSKAIILLTEYVTAQTKLINSGDSDSSEQVKLLHATYAPFKAILHDKGESGNQAIAWLVNTEQGAHHIEMLRCEAIIRGEVLVADILSYQKCLPRISIEPLDFSFEGNPYLPGEILASIQNGESCEHY